MASTRPIFFWFEFKMDVRWAYSESNSVVHYLIAGKHDIAWRQYFAPELHFLMRAWSNDGDDVSIGERYDN